MGKIFGIADLPVSTIMTPFEPMMDFAYPKETDYQTALRNQSKKFEDRTDKFISKTSTTKPNSFIKMRNGFGKLMKHFSRKLY